MGVKCVGALLVRNEAASGRYLQRVLDNAKQFCDELVVLDDASTDDTVAVCKAAGATVHEREQGGGWWGGAGRGESPARAALWLLAAAAAGPTGWVLVQDADMELMGITPRDFRRLLAATNVNSWAWPLYDCWDSEEQMRVDGYWQAHLAPRVWLARAFPTPGFSPSWGDREIHSGHLPMNYVIYSGLAPPGMVWRHLGYVEKHHRLAKHKNYVRL